MTTQPGYGGLEGRRPARGPVRGAAIAVPIALLVAAFVAEWAIARNVAERELVAELGRARKGSSTVRARATSDEEREAWAAVASSTSASVVASESHTSGALPFVFMDTTFCMHTEVLGASGRRPVDFVVEVEARLGIFSVRWHELSARRRCTCATGEDQSCELEAAAPK